MKDSFFHKLVREFSMLWFIMALGFGGTSIAGFAFLNYTMKRTPDVTGLLNLPIMNELAPNMGQAYNIWYQYLKYHIAAFGILHVVALVLTTVLFVLWRRNYPEKYQEIANDPSKVSLIIAPALSVGMTFNVFLIGSYVYIEWVQVNMQSLMSVALIAWTLIWLYTMYLAIKIQSTTLLKGFDVSKMHFGWLLVPFALGMTAVAGAGIAALAKDPMIAKTAFFMSLMPFTMAIFLTGVKLVSLFVSHYEKGMPTKVELLPSFLIIVPITTLLSISLFRYGHFFEHHSESHLPAAYFAIVTAGGWAFMSWYIGLGLVLLKNYWKNNLLNMKYFDESQWGLICPMVAFAVLGSFVYKTLLPVPWVMWLIAAVMILDVLILISMLVRQYLKLTEGLDQKVMPSTLPA